MSSGIFVVYCYKCDKDLGRPTQHVFYGLVDREVWIATHRQATGHWDYARTMRPLAERK